MILTIKEKINLALSASLKQAVEEGALPDAAFPPFRTEYPREQRFGDYASAFAMEAAKTLRRPPTETAAKLKPYIEKYPVIERVEIANPGYINIFVSFDELAGALSAVLREDDGYGTRRKDKPAKINIEFVSANPTGPLNTVSARAAALGDTIANLMEAAGDTVEREFYVNDYGNQVRLLGLSVLARIRELKGKPADFPEEGYHGEYIKDIAAYIVRKHSSELETMSGEELAGFCAETAVEYNVERQRRDLADFRVNFNRWFREKSLHESGALKETLELLQKCGAIYEQEKKLFLKSTNFGDDKDRVLVRDDGRPTYFLADIAYHRDKINRGYDMLIDIWGPDHHGYISRLKGAAQALGFPREKLKVLIAQQVNLIMEGETVKMSKRLGNFSTMRELIDEIGTDVSRYFFLMRSMESHLDFDLALAKKSSSENPVFYLQYAHARICSLFREAKSRGLAYRQGSFNPSLLKEDGCIQLMKLIAKYPEEIFDAAETIEPHRVPNFLLKLAQGYHRFYTDNRVLTEDLEKSNTYLNLCDGVRRVLRNGLRLLGVSAPERM